jgi:hypothetical protein
MDVFKFIGIGVTVIAAVALVAWVTFEVCATCNNGRASGYDSDKGCSFRSEYAGNNSAGTPEYRTIPTDCD